MQRRAIIGLTAALLVLATACGDDGGGGFGQLPGGDDAGSGIDATPDEVAGAVDGDAGPVAGGASGEVTPEAGGELAMNTIRIGSQVWERTLPMTSGQCFLYESAGPDDLPTSATMWGTADGDDGIHLNVSHDQQGGFEAQIDSDDFYWVAGERNGVVDELTIELDHENLVISGSGVFTNFFTNETAEGSFAFQCDPEDQ